VDFALTDEQELLRDSTRALLARECPPALLRAHMDDLAAAAPLWDHLREFTAVGVGPVVDLCVLMEELGYVVAPVPFFGSAVLAAPVLEAIGSELVGPVLSGEQTATVALAGPEGLWVLNDGPYKSFVPDVEIADLILAIDGRGAVVLRSGIEQPQATLHAPEQDLVALLAGLAPAAPIRVSGDMAQAAAFVTRLHRAQGLV